MAVHGSRSDLFIWHRYYIPSYVMAALLAAFGLELALRRWGRRIAAGLLLVPLALLAVGYPRFDRSRYRIAEDFSRKLLDSLPPGATPTSSRCASIPTPTRCTSPTTPTGASRPSRWCRWASSSAPCAAARRSPSR